MKKAILIALGITIAFISGFLLDNKKQDQTDTVSTENEKQIKIKIPANRDLSGIPTLHKFKIKEEKDLSREIFQFHKKKPLPERKQVELEEIAYTPYWKSNFKSPRLIDSRENFIDRELTKYKRESLIQVEDMKYPHIKVEEIFEINPETNEESLLSYKESVANHLIMQVRDDEILKQLKNEFANVTFKRLNSRNIIAEFKEFDLDTVNNAIQNFEAVENVKYAEPDYIVHTGTVPDDGNFSQLWGMNNTGQTGGTADADIDAPEAWNLETGSRNIVVAVIDTGVDYNHNDLNANMWKNPGETGTDSNGNNKESNGIDDDGNGYVDDVYGYDFINNDSDPIDNDHYHGTHCAGTIGGVGNNGQGVAGVNWQVSMMAIKFLGPYGGYTSDAVLSVEYATQMGADLSSNSWGGGGYSQALKDAIDDASVNGSLFIAAAGNSGVNTDSSAHYPSSYSSDNVISVAATDHNDGLASFSNYGSSSVDLGAPGVSIYSTSPNNSYRTLSGTSMATPHVSGVVALLKSYYPSESMVELKNRLLNSGDSISSLSNKCTTGKRLNAFNALNYSNDKSILTSPGQSGDLTSTSVTFQWTAGVGADTYRLTIGTSPGAADLFDSGTINTTSATAADLPEDGSAVYVRLYSNPGGSTSYNDYTFKSYTSEAYLPVASEMTAPENGSTFTSATVTFEWTEGRQVGSNWIYAATYQGGCDIYTSQAASGVSLEMPIDGSTVYIRLWSYLPEGWVYKDYQYTAFYDPENAPIKAEMLSPVPGTTLESENISFVCSEGRDVTSKYLYVGTAEGYSDIAYGTMTDNRKDVYVIPNGETVYVRLWSCIGSTWKYCDYEYTAHYDPSKIPEKSLITSPESGTVFTSDKAVFEWTQGNLVNRRMIAMGSYAGSSNFGAQYLDDSGSSELSVPTSGETVYVRLYSEMPNGWKYEDYEYGTTYIEPAKAELTSPVNGTVFTEDEAEFSWDKGIGVKYKYLTIGSSPGSYDIKYKYIYSSENSVMVKLPIDGRRVYARLHSYIDGNWEYIDYEYTAATLTPQISSLLTPDAGTKLTNTEYTFTWDKGVGVSAWCLWLGTRQGARDISDDYVPRSGERSRTKSIQLNGDKLYVRLLSCIGSRWFYKDYVFEREAVECPGNILPSWGFEDESVIPYGWTTDFEGTNFLWDDTVMQSGSMSAKLTGDENQTVDIVSAVFNINSTQPVNISGYCKTDNVSENGANLAVFITYTDDTTEWRNISFSGGTHDWEYQLSTLTFEKKVSTIQLYCQLINSGGEVWFDSLGLDTRIRKRVKKRYRKRGRWRYRYVWQWRNSGNMVVNYSFEDVKPSPDGWSGYATRSSKAIWDKNISKSGERSIRLYNHNNKTVQWYTDWVNVDAPSRTFVLSANAKANRVLKKRTKRGRRGRSKTIFRVAALVKFDDGSATWRYVNFNHGTYDWIRKAQKFTFSKDIDSVKVYCQLINARGNAWFDNICLSPEYYSSDSSSSSLLAASSANDDGDSGSFEEDNTKPEELSDYSSSSKYTARSGIGIGSYFAAISEQDFTLKVLTSEREYLLNYRFSDGFIIHEENDYDVEYTNLEDLEASLITLFGDDILSAEVVEE